MLSRLPPATRLAAARPDTATPDELLRLDRQLCFALYSSSLLMTKLYKHVLGALGLTYPQYLVLLALWQADAVGVSELGDQLYLDSGTLTPLLKRMEVAGFLERKRSSQDERRVDIRLRPAGRKLKKEAARVSACVIRATACPVPELVSLTRQVQALRTQLTT